MLRVLFFIWCLGFISGNCYAQQSGAHAELVVIQNKPLYYAYSKAEDLLASQKMDNAFEIKLNSAPVNLNTYAQLMVTGRNASSTIANNLALRLAYKNAPGTVANASEILLSRNPVLLFTQPASLGRTVSYSYVYDFIIKSFTTFVRPDTYNFSIIFTVTPE